MKYILRIYRILLIMGVLLLFGWLIYKNLIVTGQITIVKDFCQESPFISNLYPENRAGGVEIENGFCFQRFFIEPIYFKVKVARTFAKAKVKIIYQNPSQDIFQLGLLQRRIDPLDWKFQLKLLENNFFDNLDWFKLSEQGITLWQKSKKFETIYDFVNNVPVDQKTATFFYQFDKEAIKNPTKVVVWNPKTPLQYVDYIISQYQTPKISSGFDSDVWREQTAEFEVNFNYMNDHALEFMLSSPNLTENRNEIKISRIEVDLSRPPVNWASLSSDIKNYLIRKIFK